MCCIRRGRIGEFFLFGVRKEGIERTGADGVSLG